MIGIDLLGIGSRYFPIQAAINVWPQGYGVGAFDGKWPHAFGDPLVHVQALVNTGKVPFVRIHIWWDPTHQGLVPMDVLSAACVKWQRFAQQTNIKVYLSHTCEYGSSNVPELQKRIAAIKTLAPLCVPVSTPEGGHPAIPGTIYEQHGSRAHVAPGQAASMDGSCASDIDSEGWFKKNSNAAYSMIWDLRCNGSHSGSNPTPDQRQYYPDKKYLLSLIRLTQPRGTPPVTNFPFAAQVRPFDGINLWKAQAEDIQGDKRAFRPCLISTEHAPQADVIDMNGKVLGHMVYRDPFIPAQQAPALQRYRYYSGGANGGGLYGYEFGQMAIANSGQEWCWVRVNNRVFGPISPAFRTGSYLS